MSEVSTTISSTLSSILSPDVDVGAPLSTAFMSLGTAIDQLNRRQDNFQKEMEQIRRMSRTNWLMVINMPLPFGQTKCQAIQQLFCHLEYSKPLFDAEAFMSAHTKDFREPKKAAAERAKETAAARKVKEAASARRAREAAAATEKLADQLETLSLAN